MKGSLLYSHHSAQDARSGPVPPPLIGQCRHRGSKFAFGNRRFDTLTHLGKRIDFGDRIVEVRQCRIGCQATAAGGRLVLLVRVVRRLPMVLKALGGFDLLSVCGCGRGVCVDGGVAAVVGVVDVAAVDVDVDGVAECWWSDNV